MAEKILSEEQIASLDASKESFSNYLNSYLDSINKVIESFERQDIVQKLYEVGNFGKKQQQEIIDIKAGLEEFCNLIMKDNGLVAKTDEFVENARKLNQTGKM